MGQDITGAPTLGGRVVFETSWAGALMQLKADWDSYGAPPIKVAALETIGSFAVVPCSSGGVQLEIHRDGYDIEIEVAPDGRIKSAFIAHEGN